MFLKFLLGTEYEWNLSALLEKWEMYLSLCCHFKWVWIFGFHICLFIHLMDGAVKERRPTDERNSRLVPISLYFCLISLEVQLHLLLHTGIKLPHIDFLPTTKLSRELFFTAFILKLQCSFSYPHNLNQHELQFQGENLKENGQMILLV